MFKKHAAYMLKLTIFFMVLVACVKFPMWTAIGFIFYLAFSIASLHFSAEKRLRKLREEP